MKDIPDFRLIREETKDEDMEDPDVRISQQRSDAHIQPDNEMSDSEDEGDDRRDETNHMPTQPKKLRVGEPVDTAQPQPQLVLTTNGINILSNTESTNTWSNGLV
jgi:hypothetical protein